MREIYKMTLTEEEYIKECICFINPEKGARYLIKKYCAEHGISDVEDTEIHVIMCDMNRCMMWVEESILDDGRDYFVIIDNEFDGDKVVISMTFYGYEPANDVFVDIKKEKYL